MKTILAGVLTAGLLAVPAFAQSDLQFVTAFAGRWQVYDPQMATGKVMCALDLSGATSAVKMSLKTAGCNAPLDGATSWSIENGQLVVSGTDDKIIVRLGGNQKRITGETANGQPIVLERPGGDGSAGSLMAAYNASGCYFLGYTQKCAPQTELASPPAVPGGKTQIEVGVDLSAHDEPRSSADVVGVVHRGTCVAVESCIMASDGPWCRAKFGDAVGWLRKLAIRQNRWPIVAFTNSCS